MNCQICQSEMDPIKGCPNCGPQPGQPISGIKPARKPKLPTSVYMVVDNDSTGSTEPYAHAIPILFEKVGTALQEQISEIRYDLWTHGDLDEAQQPIQLARQVALAEALTPLKSVIYGGGGDPPESHADQIENLLAVTPWPVDLLGSRNVLLMFLTDDTKPPRSGKTMRQIGKECKDRRVFPFLVCQETPSLREFVEAADGFLIPISTAPDDNEIRKVVSKLTATITATVSRGATIPLSALPSQTPNP